MTRAEYLSRISDTVSELNARTDEMDRTVTDIEARLSEMGVSVTVSVRTAPDVALYYGRIGNRFRIGVLLSQVGTVRPFTECTRAEKTETYPLLDDLLRTIATETATVLASLPPNRNPTPEGK